MREQILAYMRRWIGILRLGDEWEIGLKVDPALAPLGYTKADPRYGVAVVSIRDPAGGQNPDWRRTVIHELLHVRIPIAAPVNSELCNTLEHSVEMLARVLFKMDSGGADTGAMFRRAHAWARTITTARVGARMSRMGNGKRAMEIVAEAAKMGLKDEAMALITELAGFAVDDAGTDDGSVDPMAASDPAKVDPMLATDPAKATDAMMRTILGDGYKAFRENVLLGAKLAADNARAGVIAMARRELGDGADRLTPEDEASLLKRTPSEAAIWLEGRKGHAVVNSGGMAREGGPRAPLDAGDGGPILAPGEDAAKVHPVILQSRAAQAAQFGRVAVEQGLAAKGSI